jgi:hypothetical protein
MMPTVTNAPTKNAGPAGRGKLIKVGQSATINLAQLEKPSEGDVGKSNLFIYPPKPAPKPTVVATSIPPYVPPTNPTPTTPIVPPPPPFRAFKYEGMSVQKNSGKILAAISEGGNVYQLEMGECIQGTYCVSRLTETDVEIEDLQLKRKQTFRRQ